MCKKLMFLISLVLLLGLVNSASGLEIKWIGGFDANSWCVGDNWIGGVVPGLSDEALINPPPEQGPVINCDVTVGDITGPRADSNDNQVMDVIAGNTVVNGNWYFCGAGPLGTGTINIYGSPTISVGGSFIGHEAGTAVIDINDSPVISIGDDWRVGDGADTVWAINIAGSPDITLVDRWSLGDATNSEGTVNISGGPTIQMGGDWKAGDGDYSVTTVNISGSPTIQMNGWRPGDSSYSTHTINVTGSPIIEVGGSGYKTADAVGAKGYLNMDSGTIVCNGDWKLGEGVDIIQTMNGGSIEAHGNCELYCFTSGSKNVIVMNDGEFHIDGELRLNTKGAANATAHLNMNGGLITMGLLVAPYHSVGSARVTIVGGTVATGGIDLREGGIVNFISEVGTLVIDGDAVADVEAAAEAGLIGGFYSFTYKIFRGALNIDYDVRNAGKTTVSGIEPDFGKAWAPRPPDGYPYASVDEILEWCPGDYVDTHAIYFGTDYATVDAATDAFTPPGRGLERYDILTFDPENPPMGPPVYLELWKTYYWRIDELGTPYCKGDVWTFSAGCESAPADQNKDCLVDFKDFALIAETWQQERFWP